MMKPNDFMSLTHLIQNFGRYKIDPETRSETRSLALEYNRKALEVQ